MLGEEREITFNCTAAEVADSSKVQDKCFNVHFTTEILFG